MTEKKFDVSTFERDFEKEVALDLPIVYKGVEIFPVRVRDKWEFEETAQILTIDRRIFNEPEFVKMSYLKFLFTLKTSNLGVFERVSRVFGVCLKQGASFFMEGGKPHFSIGERVFGAKDFDVVRKIVCLQNKIPLKDEFMTSEEAEDIRAFERLRAKERGEMRSFEEILIAVSGERGCSFEDVYNMTIRKFSACLDILAAKTNFETNLAIMCAGMKLDEPLTSWLAKPKERGAFFRKKVNPDGGTTWQ